MERPRSKNPQVEALHRTDWSVYSSRDEPREETSGNSKHTGSSPSGGASAYACDGLLVHRRARDSGRGGCAERILLPLLPEQRSFREGGAESLRSRRERTRREDSSRR